ncbi:hypothetical protein LEP1GSC038_1982 [Leptospira weilii str. 2006001855]|uniref:Uncharacterized protein n=1 Tax=Leptospira weilii str. 2006001855 TaxID=996804 RepID=M6FIU5_9LEPT|nr:hypothetical protein LEP1GSC038_1982 [Leptospira weilii str. 2006001855]
MQPKPNAKAARERENKFVFLKVFLKPNPDHKFPCDRADLLTCSKGGFINSIFIIFFRFIICSTICLNPKSKLQRTYF